MRDYYKGLSFSSKQENISFEQVIYNLFFDAAFITHKSTFGLYFSNNKAFNKLLEYNIFSESTDNILESLSARYTNAFFIHFWTSFEKL